jgi:outer membrane lipoprotein-sorting protein
LLRFNSVCADLAKHQFIKGQFEQTKTISRLKRSLVSQGNFIIAADTGMVWETLKPFPSTMAVGRDYLIQSVPNGAKTKMDAAENETFLRLSDTLSAIFTGNSKQLLDNFDNYFTEGAGASWTLGLIPRDKAIQNFAARIIMSGVQSGVTVIHTISIYEQNGDFIRYMLSNHSYPEGLSSGEKALFSL